MQRSLLPNKTIARTAVDTDRIPGRARLSDRAGTQNFRAWGLQRRSCVLLYSRQVMRACMILFPIKFCRQIGCNSVSSYYIRQSKRGDENMHAAYYSYIVRQPDCNLAYIQLHPSKHQNIIYAQFYCKSDPTCMGSSNLQCLCLKQSPKAHAWLVGSKPSIDMQCR